MRKPKTKIKKKTNRSAMARFKMTATGKIKRNRSMKRHILTKKASKRLRKLSQATLVSKADVPAVRAMITA
jgi:large subunit ribosomal protein L35